MASIYNNIGTAKELIADVKAHGFNTDIENICRAQDIFGHSSVEELAALANENQNTFYMILFKIWNWREATTFYNEHSNPDDVRTLKKRIE